MYINRLQIKGAWNQTKALSEAKELTGDERDTQTSEEKNDEWAASTNKTLKKTSATKEKRGATREMGWRINRRLGFQMVMEEPTSRPIEHALRTGVLTCQIVWLCWREHGRTQLVLPSRGYLGKVP